MPRFKPVECCFCVRKLKYKYLRCAKCQIDICIKCFCFGVEEGEHSKSHPYLILDTTNDVLFKKDVKTPQNTQKWTLEEEINFLGGLDRYKCGNWTDISSEMSTKTPQECRGHFLDNCRILNGIKKHINFPGRICPIYDHTNGTSEPELWQKLPAVLLKSEEEKVLGFNALRNDFVVEFNDKAENIVTAIEPKFDSSDSYLRNALCASLVDIYKQKLIKRHKNKHLMRQHNLIPHVIAQLYDKPSRDFGYFQRQMIRRNFPNSYRFKSGLCCIKTPPKFRTNRSLNSPDDHKDENEVEEHSSWNYNASHLSDDLKPFLNFLTPGRMRQLHENLKTEYILKTEISLLKKCMVHGIFSLKDYKNYEKSTVDPINSPLPISANRKRQLATNENTESPKTNPKRRKSIQQSFNFVNKIRQVNRLRKKQKQQQNDNSKEIVKKPITKKAISNLSPRKTRNMRRKLG